MTKEWGLWHREACHQCGREGYATRTEPKKPYRYLGAECETWEAAEEEFSEREKQLVAQVLPLHQEVDDLKENEETIRLLKKIQRLIDEPGMSMW